MERNPGPLPDELLALVLHGEILGRGATADGAVNGPLVIVRPGFLAHRELAALFLGSHGDKGRTVAGDVLGGPHMEGDGARLAGFRLEGEPLDRAADEPVIGSVERVHEVTAFRHDGLGVRRRRDREDRGVVRVELLFFDIVAGGGSENRRSCGNEAYYLMFHKSNLNFVRPEGA